MMIFVEGTLYMGLAAYVALLYHRQRTLDVDVDVASQSLPYFLAQINAICAALSFVTTALRPWLWQQCMQRRRRQQDLKTAIGNGSGSPHNKNQTTATTQTIASQQESECGSVHVRDVDGILMGTSLLPSLVLVIMLHLNHRHLGDDNMYSQDSDSVNQSCVNVKGLPVSLLDSCQMLDNDNSTKIYYLLAAIVPGSIFALTRLLSAGNVKVLQQSSSSEKNNNTTTTTHTLQHNPLQHYYSWLVIQISPFIVTLYFVALRQISHNTPSAVKTHTESFVRLELLVILLMTIGQWLLTCQIMFPTIVDDVTPGITVTPKLANVYDHAGRQCQTNENDNTTTPSIASLLRQPPSPIFRPGEWLLVGSVIHILLTNYVLRYVVNPLWTTYGGDALSHSASGVKSSMIAHHGGAMFSNNECYSSLSTVFAVSHGGLVGCFVGCSLASSKVAEWLQRKIMRRQIITKKGNKNKPASWVWSYYLPNTAIVLQTAIICICGFGCVELVLRQQITPPTTAYYRSTLLFRGDEKEGHHIIWGIQVVPLFVQWIAMFLVSTSSSQGDDCQWGDTSTWDDNNTISMDKTTATTTLQDGARFFWFLVYWVAMLCLLMPCSILLAMNLHHHKHKQQEEGVQGAGAAYYNGMWAHVPHSQRVVVARKYFHLVAVILFVPVTMLAPSLMVLAYSVALALLVVIESMRINNNNNATPMQVSACSSTSSGGARKGRGSSHEGDDNKSTISESSLGKGTSRRLLNNRVMSSFIGFGLDNFYSAFLDDKDQSGKQGGAVTTHAALILGCAIPLWVCSIITESKSSQTNLATNWLLAPLVGVLALGVGDACGAVFGIFLGHRKWPGGSKRTLEGSLAMYLSMLLCVELLAQFFFQKDDAEIATAMTIVRPSADYRIQVTLLALTLLEAATDQVDNLCLPLYGVTLLLALNVD
jgi:dolichol kinase